MTARKSSGRPKTADGRNIPMSLKLEFSKAADVGRVEKLFDPAVKKKTDPNHFVVKRDDAVLHGTIAGGGAGFLSGSRGAIYTITIAYPMYENKNDKNTGKKPDYMEVGTTMARMGGYSSARLVISAISLKEWWVNNPKNLMVAEIDPGNAPSLKTFTGLDWQPVSDQKTENTLFKLCNETIAPEDQGNPTVWFEASNTRSLQKMARTVLDYMDQGGIMNKRTGHKVAVNFNALDDIGLTRKRLEAVATGQTNKKALMALG